MMTKMTVVNKRKARRVAKDGKVVKDIKVVKGARLEERDVKEERVGGALPPLTGTLGEISSS